MICSETSLLRSPAGATDARHRALLIGPAAALALSRPGAALQVHSVFPSTLNLEIQGADLLVALSGPSGSAYPHAVVLEHPGDFTTWGLPIGTHGRVGYGALRIQHPGSGSVVIDLSQARRPLTQGFPLIDRLGEACRACANRLAEIQVELGCELRLGPGAAGALTLLGGPLKDSALALGEAAKLAFATEGAGTVSTAMEQAVAALVGLGPGLTPSGDDFLCGFMAAVGADGRESTAARRKALDLLHGAVTGRLGATTEVSASLLRAAMKNCWPVPMVELAQALAADDTSDALAALEALCGLGHSSGADMATGLLFGLDVLAAEPRASPGPSGSGFKERSLNDT